MDASPAVYTCARPRSDTQRPGAEHAAAPARPSCVPGASVRNARQRHIVSEMRQLCPFCAAEATDDEGFCPACQRGLAAAAPRAADPPAPGPEPGCWLPWSRTAAEGLPELPGLLRPSRWNDRGTHAWFAWADAGRPQPAPDWARARDPLIAALWLTLRLAECLRHWHEAGWLCGAIPLARVFVTEGASQPARFWLAGVRPLPIGRPRPQLDDAVSGPVFMAPEVRHGQAARLGPASDVFALAALFVGVLWNRQGFDDFGQLELCAHQTTGCWPQLPPAVHGWLGRALHPDPAQRHPTTLDAMRDLRQRLEQPPMPPAPWRWRSAATTRVGWCKLPGEDDDRPDSDFNEDRWMILHASHGDGDGRLLALVVDGITRGGGGRAAEAVVQHLRRCWPSLTSSAAVAEALQAANAALAGAAPATEAERPGACIAAIYADGQEITLLACGDVRAYVWSPQGGLGLLSRDDHAAVHRLLGTYDGGSTERTLVACLGMAERDGLGWRARALPLQRRRLVLRSSDILLLCSDGLTDGLAPGAGRWEAERRLERDIAEAVAQGLSLRQLVHRLCSRADSASGGDNITALALQLRAGPAAIPPPSGPTQAAARPVVRLAMAAPNRDARPR